MMRRVGRLVPVWMAALTIAALGGCGGEHSTGPTPAKDPGKIDFSVNLTATPVATIVVEVSAADISPNLIFNFVRNGNTASGTITVPAGSQRKITVRAYDPTGLETHEGSTTVNVASGANNSLTIVLTPLTGDQPLIMQLGSYGVAFVTPTPTSVAVNGTTQLGVNITVNGTLVSPTPAGVQFATSNPAFATVDASGLVTGVAAGSVSIVATYQGVAASTPITVGP